MSKYEKYKPSGIDWIGDVPITWKVKRLKDFTTKILGGGTPNTGIEKYWDDEKTTGIPWVAIADITKAEVIIDTDKFITAEGLAASSTQLIEKGKILYSIYASLGKVAVAGRELATNQAILSIYENPVLSNVNYLKYCLKGIEDIVGGIGSSTTQNNISLEKLRTIKFPLPTPDVQLTIANYLDHQTQKIDRLIANKKAQAEKLKELRQIEINNAVTKGLNPNVELKGSGIDWLGKIPKHWTVKRLKNVSEKITDGEHIAPNFTDSGMPFLSAKDVRENEILFEDDKFVSEKDGLSFRQRCNPERGDALIVSRGATVGRVSIVKTDRIFCLLGSVILIKPTNKVNSEFLFYALTNPKIQENLYQTSQSSAQQAIYLVNISFLKLAIPPIEEQIEISKVLADKTKLIDNLIKNIETQIEKLQELRKIKIYEAVTGKIKVNAYVEATA